MGIDNINAAIPIVYITDNNYVMPTVVSIISLFQNAKNPLSVYVLGVNLTEDNKIKFAEFNEVKLLNFDDKYNNLDLKHHHVSKAALFKFDLAEIFSKYDKILYLDSDIIVSDDIKEFLNIDITGLYAGVVKDIFATLRNSDNQRIGVENYFNSGVMLLNLAKMRQDNIKDKLLKTRLNLKSEQYMDQDVFNMVFNNCVKYLSPNFNYMLNKDNNIFTFLKFYEIKKISPVILHFAFLKPFEYTNIPYSKQWMKYYNLSPYKNIKLNLKSNPDKFKLYKKRKFNNRWVIDILGIRFSYKKGGKDFRIFYP